MFGWPQLILLLLMAMTFTIHCVNHGKSRPYNAGYYLIDAAIVLGLLYWGGFFA